MDDSDFFSVAGIEKNPDLSDATQRNWQEIIELNKFQEDEQLRDVQSFNLLNSETIFNFSKNFF